MCTKKRLDRTTETPPSASKNAQKKKKKKTGSFWCQRQEAGQHDPQRARIGMWKGAEAQLGLMESYRWGSSGTSAAPIFCRFCQHPQCFTASWSLRIFIQKQELKKLYRVSAAENSAPAPMPLPQLPGSAPSSGCPLPSPASPFQSKGYQWKQQESAGRWGEKQGPQPPPGLLPDPHTGDSGREALRDGECMSDPPKVGALRMLPASKHRARGGQAPYPGAATAPKTLGRKPPPESRSSHRPGQGGGCIHASGH